MYQMYKDKRGEWRWRFRSSNGRIIATASESYKNKADCQNSIDLLKKSSRAKVEIVK